MNITYFRNLLTAVVCLLTSLTASAQFTAKVDQVPRNDWAPVPASFSMAEVAEALGTESATLLAALDSWMAEGSTDANMFFYAAPSAPDTWSDGYTTGGEKGFWIGEDGEIISYPNGAYYANPVWSADDGTFSINIGMMPDVLKYGVYNKELKFALQYGGKTATFTIDFTVTGAEQVEIPEPAALSESKLNVVGEASITVEQLPRSGYDSDAITLTIDDLTGKLGIDGKVLANYIGELLYCTEFDTDNVGKRDSVTNTSTAGAPGFWVTDIRVNGEATGECSAATYSQGCKFFMERFSYDAETNALLFYVGQYPDNLDGGEAFFVNLYIVYGDKAYRIRVNFNVLVPEQGETLADFKKVGEETISFEAAPASSYSDTKTIRPDLETIAAALGCEIADIQMAAMKDEVDFGNSTANNGGFWFNIDGFVCQWGDYAMIYIEPLANQDWSTLSLGQYPGHLNVGDEATTNLYFIANGKYYQMTVSLKIVEPKVVDGAFEMVAQRSYSVQQTPQIDYVWSSAEGTLIDIPTEWIKDNIGTTDWVVYGLAALNEDGTEKEGNDKYTKDHNCTPYPGFWCDADGRSCGWNDNARVGITANAPEGGFALIQYPNRCQVGDTYKTKLFFVNEDNCKMVAFNFTYDIVNEVIEYENVGTESIVLPVSMNESTANIDLSVAAEALGVSVDDLLAGEYLCGMTESGLYSGGQTGEDGLAFNGQGFFDQVNPVLSFNIVKEGDNVVVTAWSEEEVAEDFRLATLFCFQIENKQYVFEVKFISETAYNTSVQSIAAAKQNAGLVYDLTGRKVQKPARGLYIVEGKKLIIK